MPAFATEERGNSVVVRFTRPEVRNPLSADLIRRLKQLLTELELRNELGQIIFTGVGEIFASGADLREIDVLRPEAACEFAREGQSLMNMIAGSPLRTTAAVNGYCYGGALDLALACSRRLASPNAAFSHPGTGLGIITGWGGTQRLPRLIGQARALEMFYTTRTVSAPEALEIGLIDAMDREPLTVALRSRSVTR